MKTKSKLGERIFTVFFMFAVTLVSMTAVSALYVTTADKASRNATLFIKKAVLEAAGIPVPQKPDDVLHLYADRVAAVPAETNAAYFAILSPDSRQTNGYAFGTSGAGLWGTITGIVGLDTGLSTLTGIAFTQQGEQYVLVEARQRRRIAFMRRNRRSDFC